MIKINLHIYINYKGYIMMTTEITMTTSPTTSSTTTMIV